MTTVLVFGTFDVFHEGHEYLLKAAKKKGNRLVAVIARDETVEKVKGKLPENDENVRKEVLEELPFVDEVRLGYLGDKYEIIREINPDVICLGYDQKTFTDKLDKRLASMGLFPKIVRMKSHKPGIFKSSKLKSSPKHS